MKIDRSAGLILFILICLSVGAAGGLATRSSVDTWYVFLQKPPLTPPSWVFAPVWTALYVLMPLAGWLIWTSAHPSKNFLFTLFIAQLMLNGIWSFLFFGMRSPLLGLIDIVWLLITIIFFMKNAWTASRAAVYCFIPYVLWVSFAAYLNAGIFWLNR